MSLARLVSCRPPPTGHVRCHLPHHLQERPQLAPTPKAAATTRKATIKFATYFADGKLDTEHAACTVRFTTDAQLKSLQKKVGDYHARIARLRGGMARGEFVRYTRSSGYKLMSSMASFHPDYKLHVNYSFSRRSKKIKSVSRYS
jgi:noranthrone synthase